MSEPTLALALGAGGARGLAHIRALQALDDLGIKPAAIAGSSIGSIIGAGYASGMSGDDMHDYVRARFENRFDLLASLWKLRPDDVGEFMAEGGPRLGEISIERVIEVFLPEQIGEDFSGLEIPLKVVATDYYAHRDHVFSSGALRTAVAASAAIPAVFLPVKIDGEIYIDGGMTNPAPFDKLAGSADIVAAIDVCGGPFGERGTRPGKVDVMYASVQLMQSSIIRAKAETHQLDICLQPDVASFRALDFLRTDGILTASLPLRDEFKRAVTAAMDNLIKCPDG
ncbi:MAG: patatin-like phospholipase family protein [Pseudomonadota bacterium]